MTYFFSTISGVVSNEKKNSYWGFKNPLFGSNWKNIKLSARWSLDDIWTYAVGCHLGHSLEFIFAVGAYFLSFSNDGWMTDCQKLDISWIAPVVTYHLFSGWGLCMFWHWLTYISPFSAKIHHAKFNPNNQYEPKTGKVGYFSSSTGHLEREIFYTTLGWLQAASWQILCMYLWANEIIPSYNKIAGNEMHFLFLLGGVTYWREIHFYWCHRGIHPWWNAKNGLLQGDIGAVLYRYCHSLHHKSYNPGPWSGLR